MRRNLAIERSLYAEFEDGETREAKFVKRLSFYPPTGWRDMDVDEKWDWLEEDYVRPNAGLFKPDDCLEKGCVRILEFVEDLTRADEVYDEICEQIIRRWEEAEAVNFCF